LHNNLVSIFIINYNGYSKLGKLFIYSIESALNSRYNLVDVVVIDNASTDSSTEILKEKFSHEIKLIKLNRNYFYAAGFEIGFTLYVKKFGLPRYILIMNNDFILDEEFIGSAVKYLRSDQNAGVVQGLILNPDRKIQSAGYFILPNSADIIRYVNSEVSEYGEKISYVSRVSGACFLLKTKEILLLRERIFNPRLISFSEDVELSLSLWSFGVASVCIPVISGVHYESLSFKRVPDIRIFLRRRNLISIHKQLIRTNLLSRYLVNFILRSTSTMIADLSNRRFYGVRGFIEGFRREYLDLGDNYPLILIPKGILKRFKYDLMPLTWINEHSLLLNRLFIEKEDLKRSKHPFLISL